MYPCHVSLLSNTQGSFVRFIVKTGLDKIVGHLTNNSLFKKRFLNRPIRFLGSNFDSGEINGNVIGSARSKDLSVIVRENRAEPKDRGRPFTFIFSQYKSYPKRLTTMIFAEVGVRFSSRYHHIMILASQAV